MTLRHLLALAMLTVIPACSTPASVQEPKPAAAAPAPPPADRKYLLERVDDASVVQLYADGF